MLVKSSPVFRYIRDYEELKIIITQGLSCKVAVCSVSEVGIMAYVQNNIYIYLLCVCPFHKIMINVITYDYNNASFIRCLPSTVHDT